MRDFSWVWVWTGRTNRCIMKNIPLMTTERKICAEKVGNCFLLHVSFSSVNSVFKQQYVLSMMWVYVTEHVLFTSLTDVRISYLSCRSLAEGSVLRIGGSLLKCSVSITLHITSRKARSVSTRFSFTAITIDFSHSKISRSLWKFIAHILSVNLERKGARWAARVKKRKWSNGTNRHNDCFTSFNYLCLFSPTIAKN